MSPARRQRLFVALELPEATRAALAAWGGACCAADPALRAVHEDALHVTVHFLGERPEEELEGLRDVVAQAPARPIRLVSAGTLWLAPRRPHVLTAALEDPSGALRALHAALQPQLAQAAPGFGDERALRPHVTVARVRRGPRPLVGAEPAPPQLGFEAVAVTLMRSDLRPQGALYEPLERLPLRSGA